MSRLILARLTPYFLIAPTVILVCIFTIYPALQTLIQSFYQPGINRSDPSTFVGIQNYIDLFTPAHYVGSRFGLVLTNTLIFSLATVIFSLPLAFCMALLINRRIRWLALWRFGYFYPTLLPLIGAASIWAFLFADTTGLLNTILRSMGHAGIGWITDPNTVLISMIVVNIWKQAGYYMIFYLAGLQNIPRDIYEASTLDGASDWQNLIWITLPLLRRTTLFLAVVSSTFAFQTVEQLQVLNQGNPANRSNFMLYFIFQLVGDRRSEGYVNAMTMILVLLLLGLTFLNFAFFERAEDDR